nr:hypothetical protein [Tanacetum cinerariifolium]
MSQLLQVHSLIVLQLQKQVIMQSSHVDGSKPSSDHGKKVDEDLRKESKCKAQEKEANVNSTNNVNTVSLTVNATVTNGVNVVGGIIRSQLLFDPNMPALEDVSIFTFSNNDEDNDAKADMNNLDTTIQFSPIPTTRINKDHPLDQVIRDFHLATQTRKMSKILEEHGFIKKEVYVCQPPGFKDPDFPDRVYKVEKALYGLHQAPKVWYETLSTYLLDNGFQRGKLTRLYSSKGIKKFGFTKVMTASTTIETQKPLLKDEDGKEVDVHLYRSMIGSLMYLTSSRPDIMFAVCACARYQVNPKVSHLHAVKRIFRLISWHCKKQTMVANSITEAEYVAASSCCGQVLWIQNQLLDYGGPTKSVIDEAIHKELGDILVRAVTTASSLEAKQDYGNITKTQSKATPNESSSYGTNSGGGLRCQETMRDTIAKTRFENLSKQSNDSLLARGNILQSDEHQMKLDELMALCTNLQTSVLDLEKTKTTQHNDIISLKMRVKKLEKRNRSSTHKLKRLYKVGLTARVESSSDEESLGEDASKQGRIEAINADEEITLVNVQDDAEMFDVNDLGGEEVFFAEQNENAFEEVVNVAQVSSTITTVTITTEEITFAQVLKALKTSNPKVKGIVFQEPEMFDKAFRRVNTFEDFRTEFVRRKGKESRKRVGIREREVAIDAIPLAVKSPRIIDCKIHNEGKKSYYQIRKIMCTYLKNMEGYKLKDLKLKEFDSIQEMFDKAFKRQKGEDDKEKAELKQLLETILDEEEVAIDAIPLAVKSSRIVDWKIYKEGKKSYYQIVRADRKSQMYMTSLDKEDLEDLYKLKMKYGSCKKDTKCWNGSYMTLVEYIP